MSKTSKNKSISTEVRIKEAAHIVFLAKGFTAATVRDVAKEAGTNVALVNYYFRSKKNLFNVVMLEKIQQLLGSIVPILNSEATTLDEKIEGLVNSYISFLSKNPELITFTMNEVRKQNFEFISKTNLGKILHQSHFMKQLKEESGIINPAHFLISLIGMIAFPFVARPMILQAGIAKEKEFRNLMEERRKFIPVWVKAMLSTSTSLANAHSSRIIESKNINSGKV